MQRIEATVGPTRAMPANWRLIAATVDTSARHASHAQPGAVTAPGWSWPSAAEPALSVTAAPLQTSVENSCGDIRSAMLPLTRM